MSNESIIKALTVAVESSRVYSHGTLIPPNSENVPKKSVRGYVPSPPTQWVIQADEFNNGLRERYDTIADGDIKLLVAATGIGKTTAMPVQFCSFSRRSGIVILPDRLFVAMNVPWIRKTSTSISVDTLRTKHVLNPPTRSMIYYLNGDDFLSRLFNNPDLLKMLDIDFIYMDEAHLKTPSYVFIRILAEQNFFKDTKVFLGTATSDGTSLVLTNKFGAQAPIPFSPNDFDVDNPEATRFSSPMHHTNMTGRVLLFLPCDKTIDLWAEYYDSADRQVMTFHTYDSHQVLFAHTESMKTKKSFVLLTWARPETSITMSIDKVMCSGYTQDFVIDYMTRTAKLVRRTVTQAERTQRMGRVNRIMPGSAFYSDVRTSPPTEQLSMTNAVYVYLWSRMYNIEIKTQDISDFEQTFSGCSDKLISLLLTSKVHPILMLSYVSDAGGLYSGWEQMKYIFNTPTVILEDDDTVCDTSTWAEHNTGPQEWLVQPISYRSKFKYPEQWQVVPAAAWIAVTSRDFKLQIPSDLASVAGDFDPILRKPSTVIPKAKSILQSSSVVSGRSQRLRPMSAFTMHAHTPTIDFASVPQLPEIPANFSQVSLPIREVPHMRTASQKSSATVEIPRTERWVEDVTVRTHKKRKSESSSSSDKADLQLKQVDPKAYINFKFYPMDEALLKEYLSAEPANTADFRNFKSLLGMKDVFQNLHRQHELNKQRQEKYFLSVVRVHNYYLTKKFQAAAMAINDERSFIDKVLSRPAVNDSTLQLQQTVNLLYAMHIESYFVGIDRRSQHSVSSDGTMSVFSDRLQSMRLTAKFYLQVTSNKFCDQVDIISKTMIPILVGNRVLGTSWILGNMVLSPYHVYQNNDLEIHSLNRVDELNDLLMFVEENNDKSMLKFRAPVEDEEILFIGYDPLFFDETVYGPAKISKLADMWLVDKQLMSGLSGSLLIATSDASVVGMYLGPFNVCGLTDYAYFTSSDAIIELF